MTTLIWLILLGVTFGSMTLVMIFDALIDHGRTRYARATAPYDPDLVFDIHVDQALEVAEPTPDLRRIK